jgi:hypothetical protein
MGREKSKIRLVTKFLLDSEIFNNFADFTFWVIEIELAALM